MTQGSALTLPRTVTLAGGGDVTLRLLGRADREAFRAFIATLTDHDLLFLRSDITDTDVIDAWLDNVDLGRTVTIVAEAPSGIVGYGSLHTAYATWSQHVGEIRVLISGSMRGKKLGRALADAIFAQALDRGIEKIVAQMTLDQKGAIATFEELGFKPEALLRDHVKDRKGNKHDLLVFAHDVREFASQMDAYGISDAASG
jgi:RimJ/RimL family protein N-acetyltransferase